MTSPGPEPRLAEALGHGSNITAADSTTNPVVEAFGDGWVADLLCYSIRRTGSNDDYQAQDLPYARYPSRAGVPYRAGTEVGGRRCPRCSDFILVTSRVVRLPRPEQGKWWVHERCYSKITVDLRDAG